MSDSIVKLIKERHFDPSFKMLTDVISTCPEDLWKDRGAKPALWQVVCHTLAGAWVWFRPAGQPFQEPPMGGDVAELKVIPEQAMTKEEVLAFADQAKARADAFFSAAVADAPYSHYPRITNLDIIMDQTRHIQHHVGGCNQVLGELGCAVPWQGMGF